MIQLLQPECVDDIEVTANGSEVRLTLTNNAGDGYVIILERGEVLNYVADRLLYRRVADQIEREDMSPPF